jgi:maltose alpha-D-glucosyltransferase/alpha-amylase
VKKLASATDPLWYKDAIIYELHVRAFADSNNDGIGDFPGLLSRLDYLQDLGITCIWLLPFFPSPLRDDGYDIANYVDVNPSYGTLSDFKQFLDAAHERNMQVMIELVINHTSDQHPWFQAARRALPGSAEREMYVWSNTDQLYKDARIIFTDTEKSNWTWDGTANAYYWHRFFSHQPDLNFDNPAVIEEVLKAMRFWLDMGVDALRMDAIPYLVERDGTSCENLPETHAAIKAIRTAIDADYANRLILAEANQWPADVRPYFGDGDECHMAFHFPLMPRIYMALRQEDRLPITDIMAQTPAIPDNCQWGLFLRNHDELTLEMVTDDERDYMYFAYSADPRMRINVGIRRRLAPLVDNNRRRIELLNSLLLSFPGTPIMYYGDELGMGDNIYLGDRNGVRTPMQWNSDRNAGFSKCDPARLYFPVVMDPIYGYQVVNVEAQLSDQSSLLHWTRNMIALRKLFQVFGRGSLKFLNPANRKILAYVRDLERGDGSHETVLCVANLSRFAQPVSLDLAEYVGLEPVEMLGYVSFPTIQASSYALTLAPYSFLWLELQPASITSESTPEPEVAVTAEVNGNELAALDLLTKGWAGMLAGHGLALLESALPAWLPNQRWFGAKTRTIQSVHVMHWVELPSGAATTIPAASDVPSPSTISPTLFFLKIVYADGNTDIYQLPLAFTSGQEADELIANHPREIVASLATPTGNAALHDATGREDFRQGMLALIQRNATLELSTTESAALEIAATIAAAATGQTAKQSIESGEAAELLQHPERATHEPAGGPAAVHLRPHEIFPGTVGNIGQTTSSKTEISEASMQGPIAAALAESSVTPAPITAQPGEAVSDTNSSETFITKHPGPITSRLDAKASSAFTRPTEPLPSRVGSAEQSNTSLLFGDRFILKLFRRLQPGQNPDVEIGRFLTEGALFERIAPYMGEIAITLPGIGESGEKITIAMLQSLVANEGDGWAWFLDQLQEFFRSAAGVPAPAIASAPGFLDERETLHEALEHGETSLKAAALLGRRTAEMHLALASPTDDPAFAAEPLNSADLVADAKRIDAQITSTLEALKMRLATLKDLTADAAALLLSRRIDLFARSHAITSSAPAGQRIRIHGDYHLGQTLRTAHRGSSEDKNSKDMDERGDFVILDFEGEPARSLSERRQKQSPLKDVAGMIRSFSYVAYAGLEQYQTANPELGHSQTNNPATDLGAWALLWQNSASAEFLRAYRETIAANPSLLPSPQQSQSLLSAYLMEKALYELLYELNNRPTWLRIPLAGILTL